MSLVGMEREKAMVRRMSKSILLAIVLLFATAFGDYNRRI